MSFLAKLENNVERVDPEIFFMGNTSLQNILVFFVLHFLLQSFLAPHGINNWTPKCSNCFFFMKNWETKKLHGGGGPNAYFYGNI